MNDVLWLCVAHVSGLTAVVTESVEDCDETVQAGPVIRVTAQAHLKGMAGQRHAGLPQGQLSHFKPHIHICGVQHDSLQNKQT